MIPFEWPIWLSLLFFLVALVYSMVGFAGGSSYLAILILAGFPYEQVPPIALVCNLIVSISAFWHFLKGGYFEWKRVLPFVIFSMPMAFLGGRTPVAKELFYFLLGFSLFAAGIRMFMPDKNFEGTRPVSPQETWFLGMPLGAVLGFLSGLVGIGGGIFLSPLLFFMRWASAKEAAAAASFFILVNSFAGLLGQLQKGMPAPGEWLLWLGLAVFFGGQLGARVGATRLPRLEIQRITAVLILYVSFSLLGKAF
ncbi:MAG: sulfite exporter TauE/SafE family protein [Candidatus Omnitrophica bacterium]|nr:sulfite exporter TauE/SafE family protein [Candidatus Omnitrophota bacterium]